MTLSSPTIFQAKSVDALLQKLLLILAEYNRYVQSPESFSTTKGKSLRNARPNKKIPKEPNEKLKFQNNENPVRGLAHKVSFFSLRNESSAHAILESHQKTSAPDFVNSSSDTSGLKLLAVEKSTISKNIANNQNKKYNSNRPLEEATQTTSKNFNGYLVSTLASKTPSLASASTTSLVNFKGPGLNQKRSLIFSALSIGADTSENILHHLIVESIPFKLDLYETFQSTCDIIIEVYRQICSMILDPADLPLELEAANSQQKILDPSEKLNSTFSQNYITSDSMYLFIKADDFMRELIIMPALKGIDRMLKRDVYTEGKRFESMFLATK